MPSTPPMGVVVFVEPLESRIAPTGLLAIAGDPNDPTATANSHYVTFQTTPTATSLGFVPASSLGLNVPHLFAIKLTGSGAVDSNNVSTGDELVIFNSVTGFNASVPNIQATKGPLYAFFLDRSFTAGDTTHVAGQVYADELVGVSMGKKAAVTINGNVYGDIATNLLNGGTTLSLTSLGKPNQGINGILMNGNVYGDILAAGTIKNVKLVGSVDNILAGTATNGATFNFSGNSATSSGTITNVANPGQVGSGIVDSVVSTLANGGRIQAGDGGFTGVGGAVSGLTLTADANAFSVFSGAGGDGGVGTVGGAGGAISNVIVVGTGSTTVNEPILIQAGHGGNNGSGAGGKGGALDGVAVGFNDYDANTNTGTLSADLLTQNVTLLGGDGGGGLKGGNGGVVGNSQIAGHVPDDGVIGADGSANPEMQVLGGAGGAALVAGRGKGGRGGNVAQVTVQNFDVDTAGLTSSILLRGGAGGAGKPGGNVSNVDLLGAVLGVEGGAGGTGIGQGGAGGSLNGVSILNLTNLFAHNLTLNGGQGGDATGGSGGAGGSVNNVVVPQVDLTALAINTGTHANGGAGENGIGGAGGAVTNIDVTNGAISGVDGTVTVRTGVGGPGSKGGGAGGGIDTLQLVGMDFSFTVATGAGGNVFSGSRGNGGAGGDMTNVGISNAPTDTMQLDDPTPFGGTITSGAGGIGRGKGSNGGKGGDMTGVNVRSVYDLTVAAGDAGNGKGGAGTGGGLNGAVATSLQGGVTVSSGMGGQRSGTASDGGAINGLITAAKSDISIVSGNGGSGGSGGLISNSGSTTNELYATPNFGNLTVTAGNGSSKNGVAGTGGTISGFTGYVAASMDGETAVTALTAGVGGGGDGATASGHGGAINTVQLTGTSADEGATQIVTLDGGNAGVASGAVRGRNGGNVSNVSLYNLDTGTIIQHIAAGDGAGGLKKGGGGGTVSGIHVGVAGDTTADIGIRSGAVYGYAVDAADGTPQAGGIFAGIGGIGGRHSGANGDVTDVTANAISSIVAGKGTPQLCTEVDKIYLAGLTATAANADGSFTSTFDTANLVGSVQNPTAAGASVFKAGDGLVAAANLTQNRDFVPEAELTLDGGTLVLLDYQQPNPIPVEINPAPSYLG